LGKDLIFLVVKTEISGFFLDAFLAWFDVGLCVEAVESKMKGDNWFEFCGLDFLRMSCFSVLFMGFFCG
jgi:hypothetical protein